MEAGQNVCDLGIDVVARAHHPPPVAAAAETFGDRKADRLQWREVGIKLVDLESPRQATQHALVHGQIGDVLPFEQDTSRIRLEHTGELVDDRGLAGAVGADQRMARALRDSEREVAGDAQAPEMLFQPDRFQRDSHCPSLSGMATAALRPATCAMRRFGSHSTQRCRRARPTITITTRTTPIQNCQYCGVMVENTSCSILNTTAPIRPP